MEGDTTIWPDVSNSRKRRKKGRIIQKGYPKYERSDARRVAAKAFLSSIPLDNHILPRARKVDESTVCEPAEGAPSRPISSASRHSNAVVLGDEHSNLEVLGESRLYEITLDNLAQLQHSSPSKLLPSKSLDYSFGTPSPANYKSLPFSHSVDSQSTDRRPTSVLLAHKRGRAGPSVYNFNSLSYSHAELLTESRLMLSAANLPYVTYSVLPYRKNEDKFKPDYPKRARTRANSMSLQFDLDIELGTTTDVSLANLLNSLWVESPQPESMMTPPLHRRQSFKRQPDSDKRTALLKAHVLSEPPSSLGSSYPWQSFREHHSTTHVLQHYHPRCLDNYEYFIGRNTTTMTLNGYRVSIVQYAKKSDVKKGINEQFSDVFPYIKITLTKLRSIKREMQRIALECGVDLAAIANSYVYFEKLVLMGKINKANRKLVAGTCLLLAVKFSMDIKRSDIKQLIEKIADIFRIPSKELTLYELPVLVSLQFSLLTPTHQSLAHYDRLKELAMT